MKQLDPLGDGISLLSLVRIAGSDLDIVNAARVSYGKESEQFSIRDEKLIHYLLSHGHTSPFEHTHLVFQIKLPVFIARQWMRHRIGVSYNEVSGRYTQIPLEFYIPKKWRVPDQKNHQGSIEKNVNNEGELFAAYKNALNLCGQTSQQLLQGGVAKELARGVLPFCTYTQFIFTCNLVSLFHFIKLRYDYHAQLEIQCYAKGMLELAQIHFPVSVKVWCELNGYTVTNKPIQKKEKNLRKQQLETAL
jgi:thymidylate synthase (FAD)